MPATLYLSRVSEPLQLDARRQLPDAWARWDLLGQGLVSRYLARASTAADAERDGDWVLLHPFVVGRRPVYGVWNSARALKAEDLAGLRELAPECHVDASAFSAAEMKVLRGAWSDLREWTP